MSFSKRIGIGLVTLFAAWLCVGQAALVYAADPPTTPTGTTTTTTPANNTSTSTNPADPNATSTDLPGSDYTNATDTNEIIKPTCSGGGLGWIVCPLINAGVETISKVSQLIIKMLETKPLTQDTGLYNAWKAFRDLADVLFILIFMILIFGNLAGTEGGSYQLKSLLPKLVIAAIGVQASFFITAFIIDIGNVSGAGVGAIFSQLGVTAGNTNDVTNGIKNLGGVITIGLTSFLAITAGFILTWPVVALMLLGFLISVLGVFATLAIRQLLIALLIVLSPLAFAAFVLPNTSHFFKHWHRNLLRVILVYPMIVALLAIGGFVARIAKDSDGVFGSHEVNVIFASLIPILVFLAIPATFKAASGVMERGANLVFNRHDRVKGQLGGSQLRKDLKEARQERGFINQRDIKGAAFPTKVRRGVARLQAGQTGWGQPGKRRLAKGYETAMAAQMKDWGTIFDDQGMGNADIYERVFKPGIGGVFEFTRADGSIKKVHITKAMQAQAVAQLAKQGGWVELNWVLGGDPRDRDTYPGIFNADLDNGKGGFIDYKGMPANEVADMFYRGMGNSGVMPQAIQTIPIINPGKKNRAYDGLSAAQVATMHGSGADKYFARITQNIGPDDNFADVARGKQERTSAFVRNLVSIASSADLRSKSDPALMRYFKEQIPANAEFRALLANEQIKYRNETISGVDFFDRYVSANGRIEHEGVV